MADRRIGYSKDKIEIIERLVSNEDNTGPFRLIADVLVFAAALGLKRNRRASLTSSCAEPIRHEVFTRHGYDTMMNLLALQAPDGGPEVLAESPDTVDRRAIIFEEYANGGLEILQEELKGVVNCLETTLLLINTERASRRESFQGFDLTQLA